MTKKSLEEFNQPVNQLVSPREQEDQEIQVRWDKCDVYLTLGKSTYDACVISDICYPGIVMVPEEEREGGIGTKLLNKLVEILKERGVKTIFHHVVSLEGLMLISKKLNQPTRNYYFNDEKEVTFDEAVEIMQKKKSDGEQDDSTIMITTITDLDQIK